GGRARRRQGDPPRLRRRAHEPRALPPVGDHAAARGAALRPARHGQVDAGPGPRDGGGRDLLPPEAHEPHLQVRRQHGRAPPGDSQHRDDRGQGGAVYGLRRRALARAPPAAAAGAGGERPARGGPLREVRRPRRVRPARARGEGAPRRRRQGGPAGHDRRPAACRRGPQAGAGRRREDPVRAVPVIPPAPEVTVTHVRVRYKDTDTMQVVYYGNYLTYFEVARVEFLRQHDQPISEVNTKLHMPVAEAHVKYFRPARLDDLLEVRCWISDKKRA